MSTNMQIWEKVSTTDTRYTKPAEVGGQKITSLNGTAMIMKATEVFGPVGIGFGWSVIEERFDEGAEMVSGEGDKRLILGRELNHTIKIRFWFELDGKRGEIEQYGCTRYLYKSKFGTTTDGEAPKKSLTDAIKKSLSMLGFSADVFLGMFDDAEYVNQLKDEELIEQAEDQEAEKARQQQERLDYIKSVIDTMAGAQSPQELKKIHDVAVRKLTLRKDTKGAERVSLEWKRITEADKEAAA
ncbi:MULTISPECIES: hypothetical protein [unclassified Pseudomonas]|uniref:hypothetical protein n=1 Tax=unclassified Pseudomonas TaxID=196821 RepID=UPI001462E80D|nr:MULTISPECIES: hypothetical protein [unclassified Pseudomonas]QJI21451.1 hypothetical protein HKK57_25345 [Pseudomonas sp. ADAK21]QJI23397.1 hypothetical protein HKK56_07745 [Pseudomonas sp. ADAK20]